MDATAVSQSASDYPPRERVELILSQLDELPTLPAVAARLLVVTTSRESSARDVVELIESDAALTAAILRLVRRADLGLRGNAITVAQAITLLGFKMVRNAVLSVQLYEAFSRPDENDRAAATRSGLWQHNLAVGCAAEMIAERVGGAGSAGEAFVCGLLHDIGKVALDACLPKSYARVVERVERRHVCICDIEQEIFGLDHTVAGKRLVARWGLSQRVVDSVWLHHQSPDALPSSVASARLVRIVHLADNLVRRQGIGYSGYQYVSDVEELAGSLGVEGRELDAVIERLPSRLEPFGVLIGVDDLTGRGEYTASLASANKQLGRLNAKLVEANHALQLRSACFAALEQFTSRAGEHDQIGDVCVSAAESVRGLVDADCALAFFGEASGRCIHVGVCGLPDPDTAVSVVDLGAGSDVAGSASMPEVGPAHGFVPASEGCETLWQRCVGTQSRDPLWILPLATPNTVLGGVLVSAADDVIRRFRSAAECEALSAAIGFTMASAHARVESERMNEELLNLNRRLQAAQRELVQTRSVSMIAAMAAGAAHELNNPLSVVSGRAQMELAKCQDGESARALEVIIEQTKRAAQIVTDLMRFAKPEPPKPVAQRLAEVLESLCQHWRAESPLREEQLTASAADDDATVYADPGQLDELLGAVLANAVEAAKSETARVHINSPSHASDETVRIVVEDNGVGMPPEVLEHAIDPFFSIRPAGRGRGLGLSRAYRLAESNGGRLWIDSTPDVGTTVTIELPARPPSA